MSEVRILNTGSALVDPHSLKLSPDNPRIGDVEMIKRSFQSLGFWGRVVVDRRTGEILAGNHRVLAARQLGMTEIPVEYVETDSDTHARQITAADNRANDLARYDEDSLSSMLRELASANALDGTGYENVDVETLLRPLLQEDAEPFQPNLAPSIRTREYTDEDVARTADRLESQFEREQKLRTVICPHCQESFMIDEE